MSLLSCAPAWAMSPKPTCSMPSTSRYSSRRWYSPHLSPSSPFSHHLSGSQQMNLVSSRSH